MNAGSGEGARKNTRDVRNLRVWLVGNSHLDLAWLWTWEETSQDIVPETFRAALRQMDALPGLTFASSHMAFFEAIERNDPALFEEVRERIREGAWEPIGGMWVEIDANLPCGEAIVRQCLVGQEYAREKFGKEMKIAWLPDSFGHAWTLPQILKQCGLEVFLFKRCLPEKKPLFWWEGPDGTRVLAGDAFGQTNIALPDYDFRSSVREYANLTGLKDILFFFGRGDHGGGLQPADVQTIRSWQADGSYPEVGFCTPEAYFARIRGELGRLPVHRGELNPIFPGSYTTQARIKKLNRKLERLLLDAETISAFAVLYHKVHRRLRQYYPWRSLREAWKLVLRNQFHDILPGTCIPAAAEEACTAYAGAERKAGAALRETLDLVAGRVDSRGEGIPVVVFNLLGWDRSNPCTVSLELEKAPGAVEVRARDGSVVPSQVSEVKSLGHAERLELSFLPRAVPGFGYDTYHVASKQEANGSGPAATGTDLKISEAHLENEFLRVELDPKTGWLRGIKDKRTNRQVLSGPGNVLVAIGDKPLRMDAWVMKLTDEVTEIASEGRIEILERGPIRCRLCAKSRFHHSWFSQEISLTRGMPIVEFELKAGWYERRTCLKVVFPLNVPGGCATFDIPFGHIVRPADGTEVPALKWVDMSADDFGVSLLSECKYGFDARENVLRMTLLRGSTTPDPNADRGHHAARYALFPHEGDWRRAGTVRRALEFDHPLYAVRTMTYEGLMPPSWSFLRVEPESVVVTCVKHEEGPAGKGTIVRLYESHGRPCSVSLTFPIPVDCVATDFLERPLEKIGENTKSVGFDMRGHEIKCLKVVSREVGPALEAAAAFQ